MPRTAQEILDHADELAARFEAHEPGDDVHDATELRLVREAFLARAEAERALGDAVIRARHNGHSWASKQTDRDYTARHFGHRQLNRQHPSRRPVHQGASVEDRHLRRLESLGS